MTPATEPKVLDDDGHFHAEDAPIDLSIYGWEDWVSLGFFLLLALDIFYQFFTRYVLSDSAAWTEEIARYLLIIVVFWGGAMAIRKNTHIHVEFLFRYLPAPLARAVSTCVDIVRILFMAYATWLALELVPKMHNLSMTVVDFPMSVIYGFVAAGFALMTWRAVGVARVHWAQGWSTLERPMEGV